MRVVCAHKDPAMTLKYIDLEMAFEFVSSGYGYDNSAWLDNLSVVLIAGTALGDDSPGPNIEVSAPVHYAETMLVLWNENGAAAVKFEDLDDTADDAQPGLRYRWRLLDERPEEETGKGRLIADSANGCGQLGELHTVFQVGMKRRALSIAIPAGTRDLATRLSDHRIIHGEDQRLLLIQQRLHAFDDGFKQRGSAQLGGIQAIVC